MAYSYLFFRPARLPLASADLSESTVLPFVDAEQVRASLERHVPGVQWESATEGRAEMDGWWLELRVLEDRGGVCLSMRCSLRHDYRDVVQGICDACGWLAFDQTPECYQPHLAPMRA